ncbi:hypothetical protein GCK72_016028 [Caenorhabditis remanei]|uniref:BED-type domain-containing protein n=1 Tax=Caenorhabditis remanei TaxID=31234 RepID=A0A6A5GXY8_CAERE|nr:hypothetical protein GCK72_016028 [Caenorhabditis remanei]KAF1759561.1 hypothetical protein GCK72_016028 [Caenorhabditis remanei]
MSNKRSKYCAHFKKIEDTAECVYCGSILNWSKSVGTNNIRTHLKNAHPDVLKQIEKEEVEKIDEERAKLEKKRQNSIQFPVVELKKIRTCETASRAEKFWRSGADNSEAIEMAVMKMIVSDNLPLRTLEKEGFQFLMKTICPSVKLKSRFHYTEKLLPLLESKINEKIVEDLKTMEHISITTDGWSSKHNNHHMLSVTAHWIDKNNFGPRYCILGCKSVYGKHNSINYCEKVQETLSLYGISESKVVRVVKDGASVMTAMCDRMDLDGLHCFAHFLQLCVSDVFYEDNLEFGRVIEKMKKIIRKVAKSSTIRDQFKMILLEEELPERMLQKECRVRWNSMFKMMSTFIESKRAIMILLLDNKNKKFPDLTDMDWSMISAAHQALEPLSETTKALQSRFSATSSVIVPCLQVLDFKYNEIMKQIDEDDNLAMKYVEGLIKALKSRRAKYINDEQLKISTFIDPRYRDAYFTHSFKENIVALLDTENEFLESSDSEVEEEAVKEIVSGSLFDRYLNMNKRFTPTMQINKNRNKYKEEVDLYLSTRPDPSVNPFQFWKDATTFPNLKNLALKYLCIPATSTESERLFSVTGMICTDKRTRMRSDRVERLTTCNLNLKVYGIEI